MSFNRVEFVNDLLKDSKLSDDQKAALQAALDDAAVSKKLEDGYLRQSDYSRLAAEAQNQIKAARDWYNELVQWEQANRGSKPADPAKPVADPVVNADYISKDEFIKELNKIQSGAIGYLSVLNDKSLEYFQEFGKRLDTAAVLKKAQEDGTNFMIAYERYIQPQREEKRTADLEVRIKREREEAAREAIANAQLPVGTTNNTGMAGGQPHVLDMVKNAPQGGFGWRAAADAHMRDIAAGTVKHE